MVRQSPFARIGLDLIRPQSGKKNKVYLKSQLLEEAAQRKNLVYERINNRMLIIQINGQDLLFDMMDGPSSSNGIRNFCDDKYLTRVHLEKNGVPVPKTKKIVASDFESTKKFAEEIGYPVVLKPLSMSQGSGVITGIMNEDQLKKAQKKLINLMLSKHKEILIEQEFEGSDYRFFGVNNKVFSVQKRMRANIVGDGVSTIKELIQRKNAVRAQNRYLKKSLIPLDMDALDHLKNLNLTLESIPNKDEIVILRTLSNLSAGGDSINVTNHTHPEFIEMVENVLKITPGIKYIGIDVLAKDITQKPTPENYIVTELEYSPGPGIMFPVEGEPMDMAGAILDYYLENYE